MKTHVLLLLALAGCARPSTTETNVSTAEAAPVPAVTAATANTASEMPANTASVAPAPPETAETAPAAVDAAATELPANVQRFIAAYEECEHWAGEEPYDADRRKEIEDGVKQSCTGIDARLKRLRKVHAADPAVIAKLADYSFVHM